MSEKPTPSKKEMIKFFMDSLIIAAGSHSPEEWRESECVVLPVHIPEKVREVAKIIGEGIEKDGEVILYEFVKDIMILGLTHLVMTQTKSATEGVVGTAIKQGLLYEKDKTDKGK